MLNHHGAEILLKFAAGMTILFAAASIIFYDYLVSKDGERIGGGNDGTVFLIRVIYAVMVVLGLYMSVTAIIS